MTVNERIAQAKATNATDLDLSRTGITDLLPLTALNSLTRLYLDNNKITDISPLATLSALTTLYLNDNQITDISPLATLSALTTLYLRSNQITDLSPLATLSTLTTLNLSGNNITDVSPLKELSRLINLVLSNNKITDISPLKELSHLINLDLSSNSIADASPLKGLNSLTRLDIRTNNITDASPLLPLLQSKKNPLSLTTIDSFFFNRIIITNNPLTTPPIETVKQGDAAVLRYFERLATAATTFIREDKLAISTPKPLNIFISYSKTDVSYKQALETHLAPLKRQGLISTWSDQDLIPGEEWDKGIQDKLRTADIILLLVSANFIATDYIWDKEMTRAIERHEKKQVWVVPIILSSCDWQSTPFAKLTALPAKGTPINKYPHQDEAWTEVVTKLRELVTPTNLKP